MGAILRSSGYNVDGIHFQGFGYLDLPLVASIGEAVVIRYDPRDMAELRLYHQGRFLSLRCVLIT